VILYHGGIQIVDQPIIINSGRTLDFGKGFYTTTNREQAENWIRIKTRRDNLKEGVLSIYNISDAYQTERGLQIKVFDGATDEWLKFILGNRLDKEFEHSYDIVYGPVANDRVYACLNAFENKFMTFEAAILELRTYKLADQISFHTDRGLKMIKYMDSEIIQARR